MYELKTKQNEQDVIPFLNDIEDERKRNDSVQLLNLMQEITGEEPKMWGDSIVGFGHFHYKYASGHEGDTAKVSFSPRKQYITLYLSYQLEQYQQLLNKLGTFKIGKGCLYLKKIEDVDINVLKELIEISYKDRSKNMI